jgi:hypothetical protein
MAIQAKPAAKKAAPPTKVPPAKSGKAASLIAGKAIVKPVAAAKKSNAELLASLDAINDKQARTRRNRAMEDTLKMREHLWPGLDEKRLWLRTDKTRKGYATMPRTMPQIINLINDVTKQVTGGKAIPAGKSYLVLWCRVFDEGFLKIDSEPVAALEAGYSGERNVTTWREHLSALKDLGFIECKEGPAGPFQYVLLFNPYQAVKALHAKGWVQQSAYTALFQRAIEVRATDLTED